MMDTENEARLEREQRKAVLNFYGRAKELRVKQEVAAQLARELRTIAECLEMQIRWRDLSPDKLQPSGGWYTFKHLGDAFTFSEDVRAAFDLSPLFTLSSDLNAAVVAFGETVGPLRQIGIEPYFMVSACSTMISAQIRKRKAISDVSDDSSGTKKATSV